MSGEGVRHPIPPIQRIVPHFKFNFNIKVLEKKLYMSIYLHITYYVNIYDREFFTSKTCEIKNKRDSHTGHVRVYYVTK